jgi:NADP-dependent 3-hydroxy acid dehydrogenase YdfG
MAPLVWLVTGCTSGFGEQFILSILARGDKAIATGRNASRLKHLEKAGAAVLHLDVTEPQDVIDATIKEAAQIHGGIDVLVNNAGYTDLGYVEDNT